MSLDSVVDKMKQIKGREIAVLLNPRPAVLVTCCDRAGSANVLSVAWQTPLSHDPPMLGVSITSRRFSHHMIVETGEFAINVVEHGMREAVVYCGTVSGRDEDKLSKAGLKLLPAHSIRPPLIEAALAHLECQLVEQIETGDHTFFVGRVVYAEAKTKSFSDSWDPTSGEALLCMRSDRYCRWSPD